MPEEQKSPLRIEPEKLIPGKGLDEMDLSLNDSSIDLISRENPIGWFGNFKTQQLILSPPETSESQKCQLNKL